MTKQIILKVKRGDYWAERKLKTMMKKGWRIVSSTAPDQGRSLTKTVGLGLIFLPLDVFGRRKSVTEYVLEKD